MKRTREEQPRATADAEGANAAKRAALAPLAPLAMAAAAGQQQQKLQPVQKKSLKQATLPFSSLSKPKATEGGKAADVKPAVDVIVLE